MTLRIIAFPVLFFCCFINLISASVNQNIFILREYLSGSENYLRKSSIKSLRIGTNTFVFNRLYLTPHEVLNFEVKSLNTSLSQDRVIPIRDHSFKKYNSPLTSKGPNLEVKIPQIKAAVIDVNKSNKLDSEEVLPLLIRSEISPDLSVDLPALISLEPNSENFTGTGSAKHE